MADKLALMLRNLVAVIVAVDCFCNVLFCMLTMQQAYAGETLSAHCWRADQAGKILARLVRPLIDGLFALESIDPTLVDEAGQPVRSHCRRSYLKTRRGDRLPPEYRMES
jgi:hypothetical protein